MKTPISNYFDAHVPLVSCCLTSQFSPWPSLTKLYCFRCLTGAKRIHKVHDVIMDKTSSVGKVKNNYTN